MSAITRHVYELDPDAPIAHVASDACTVMTIVGPVGHVESVTSERPRDRGPDRRVRLIDLELPQDVTLERRDDEWRVVRVNTYLCVYLPTY